MQTLAVQVAIRDTLPVGWFAPNYKYLGEPYRELLRKLGPVVAGKNHERFIALANGVRIDFWTLEDDDAGRGFKYGRVIIDEGGMVKNLLDKYENAIRPTMTDYSGDLVVGGTPKGRNGFYQMFMNGVNTVDGWESFQKPTSSNPFLPPAEWDRELLLNQGYPERSYQQEYLAEFLDDAGGVFIGVQDVVDVGRTRNEDPKTGVRYYGGLDLAQAVDYTVLTIFDQDGRQVYYDRFNKLSWSLTVARVANACKIFKATVSVDATGVGQPIFEALRAEGCTVRPFKFTTLTKPALIEKAVAAVQRQDVRLMDIPTQTDELKAYEYEVTKSGNVRMNAPDGMHDDTVIAVSLAIGCLERPSLMIYT